MSYTIHVDDNFHYMDEDERSTLGTFETLEAAVAACQRIVDDFLAKHYKPGITADDLYDTYTSFGDDPFIAGAGPERPFSAWDYARTRCAELCRPSTRLT